jgi:prophage tail gpP-like protein
MTREDFAALDVDGLYIDAWQEYKFDSDLFTPADAFHLTLGIGSSSSSELRKNVDKLREILKPGKRVKLWIGSGERRALQGVGIIDARDTTNDGDSGTKLTIDGRDAAAPLVDTAALPSLYEADDTLLKVARRAVAPWGIEVTADHVAGRDLRQARVTKDRLRRLQNKARALGIPPHLMSEKIAASIDKGTIDFDDFVAAQAGAYFAKRTFTPAGSERFEMRSPVTATTVDVPAYLARGPVFTGVPYSGGAGLSSLQIYQLRVKDVRPQAGETVWEFLDRHAKRNGLLMRMDPNARLVFCGMQFNQSPSYRLTRRIEGDRSANNILSGGERFDTSTAYKKVIVYGRAKGKDKARSPFKGEATDTSAGAVPYDKTLILHDNSIKSQADAQTRAEYELGKSKQGMRVLSYTVSGHSASDLIYATDTIAHVEDQVCGISGPYYITSRTFSRSATAAPMTELRLVPPGSVVLKEAA